MVGSEAICDREQCRYIGPIPEPPNLLGRILASAGIAMVFHFGCFPLLLFFPFTFPVMIMVAMGRMSGVCPACRRGKLVPDRHPSRAGTEGETGAIQHKAIKGSETYVVT